MRITSLEDLQVYQRACRAADAISAILDRPILLRFSDLRKDLAETSARIPPNIAEGFGRGTDKDCAHFQHIARGSANEMCAHLRTALGRHCISNTEFDELVEEYTTIGKMLTQWIKALRRDNRRARG